MIIHLGAMTCTNHHKPSTYVTSVLHHCFYVPVKNSNEDEMGRWRFIVMAMENRPPILCGRFRDGEVTISMF